MNPIDIHREGLRWGYELLEMVTADVTAEQAAWLPPGLANPLGSMYAHAVLGLDILINGLLRGAAPLHASAWAGKTGVSEPQLSAEFEWARRLTVDLPAMRAYGRAAYENADAYLAGLSVDDLNRQVDLSSEGMGVRTVSWVLTALITSHLNNMAGEISVLKGLQGAKGYPF